MKFNMSLPQAKISTIILILVLSLTAWLLLSCTSKSGQLVSIAKPEKVVIIQETSITYKVQRIDKGIVDYITIPDYYQTGDTILVTFN